jgi:uncharacterized integral membrane protein
MDAFARKPPEGGQPPVHHAEERGSLCALLWGAVALLMLLMLLISLMSQAPEASWRGPGARLMPHLPEPLVYALMGLLVLGAVVIVAVLFPRELRFRRKKQPDEFELSQEPPKFSFDVLVVLLFALLMPIGLVTYLYWSGGQPFGEEQELQQRTSLAPMASSPQTQAEKPSVEAPGFTWTLFAIAMLVGLGVVGGGVWILFGERLERWWYGVTPDDEARRALLEVVEISVDDLLREPDPRRAVIASYRRLEQILSQHGLPRAPWQTPFEYLRVALQRFRLPAARLRGLTGLFELAKFSAHPLGESEKRLAIAALRQVKAELEADHHVPAP